MKNRIFDVLSVLFVIAIICGVLYTTFTPFKNLVDFILKSKPYVEIRNEGVYVDEFEFTYGTIEINQLTGDFDKLNKKVFNLLKGENGKFSIYINKKYLDGYGKSTSTGYKKYGVINADELKKYASYEYWAKLQPIQSMIINTLKSNSLKVNIPVDTIENKVNTHIKPSQELHAKFLITEASINNNDYSQQFKDAGAYLVIYTDKVDGKVYFANVHSVKNTQSYGLMEQVTTRVIPQSEDTFKNEIFNFSWTYVNDYDQKTGTTNVTLVKIHTDSGIKFNCKILADNGDVIFLKGQMDDSYTSNN